MPVTMNPTNGFPTISFGQSGPPEPTTTPEQESGETQPEETPAEETSEQRPEFTIPAEEPATEPAKKGRVPYARFEEKVRQIDDLGKQLRAIQEENRSLQAMMLQTQGQTAQALISMQGRAAEPQDDPAAKLIEAIQEDQPEVAALLKTVVGENRALRASLDQAAAGVERTMSQTHGISAEMARRDLDDMIHRELAKTPELDTPETLDDLHTMARGHLAGMTESTFSPEGLKTFVRSKIQRMQAGHKPVNQPGKPGERRAPAAPPAPGATPRTQRKMSAMELASEALRKMQAQLPG